MPDLSGTMRKCRIGTAKNFTLLLLLYITQPNFQGITEQTNFYFNEKDELVIAFDEYEVAPGSMGAPEFVIPQEVTAAILK